MNNLKKLENLDIGGDGEIKSIDNLKEIIKFIMTSATDITSFAGYDLGIGVKKEDMKGYKDEALNYCQNFNIGVSNQGIFQMTSLNNENWTILRKYMIDNKDDISKINFYYLSTSLVAAASPLMLKFPFLNLFHTAIGMQLIGKNGKIKRSGIFQLELGSPITISDILTPEFCMTAVINEDGTAKSPLEFTDEEFNKNLFVDYSKSFSTIMFNFLEQEDYVTDDLVKNMACVDAINLEYAAPMPYDKFLRQNLTMKNYYDAYDTYRSDNKNKKYNGDGDGTIFCLAGFGPSPLSQTSGIILNFASTTSVDDLIKLIDFTYTNFNGCSNDYFMANQHYCLMGIDKVVPTDSLSKQQLDDILKKPNIITIDNGFVREMRGRTTHCNTTCGVYVTFIEELSKENPKNWKIYTNWEDINLQESNFYMLNPAIPNLPLAVFPDGWEYGVTMSDFNNNPIYAKDKKNFYEYMFFVRMLLAGMNTVGEVTILDISTGKATIYEKMLYYSLDLIDNKILKEIFTDIFAKKLNISNIYKETYAYLTLLFIIYLVIRLDLYEYIYWVTGQTTATSNGYNINMTDPYPTIWKIDIKNNIPVLLSYIENFFSSSNPLTKFEGKTAGQIYLENKSAYTLYDGYNQINRWVHPFPMNKFYLWFPAIKWNNICDQVKLPSDIVFYQPDINYNFVKDNPATLSTTKWAPLNSVLDKITDVASPKFDGRVTATIVITILLLIVVFLLYVYFMYFYKK
jgi:hypothetical protein